mgnify:CR=1 FL=1
MSTLKVKDYMTKDVITVREDRDLTDAVAILNRGSFRHLPVVNDKDHAIGIISDRDLRNLQTAMAFIEEAVEGLKSEIKLADVMTSDVTTVSPEMSLKEAAALIIQKKYGALPVEENSRIIGILSYTDILRAFIETSP